MIKESDEVGEDECWTGSFGCELLGGGLRSVYFLLLLSFHLPLPF